MRRFQHFSCIDWSGAKSQWHTGIAVASCETGTASPKLIPPPEKYWTRTAILHWLHQQVLVQSDMLIGLDLSFALPFADTNAYFPDWDESPVDAKSLWHMIDGIAHTDAHLSATSFVNHPEVARHFRQQRACGDLFGAGRGRLRLCESDGQALIDGINPYSCFNLVGAAQVGKSSLTGMRVLHQLDGAIPIWPFDDLPQRGPLIVEIYTSIAARASGILPKGKSKITDGATLDAALRQFGSDSHIPLAAAYTDHVTDAMLSAAWLRRTAVHSEMWQPQKLSDKIRQTEGWTFGVV